MLEPPVNLLTGRDIAGQSKDCQMQSQAVSSSAYKVSTFLKIA
jgi:hypothetical protein